MKNSSENLVVLFDNEIGAIFHAPSGLILSLDKDDVETIKNLQFKYQNHLIPAAEMMEFESYFDGLTSAKKQRRMAPLVRVDKNDTLSVLNIMVSTDCNLRCSYCYAGGGNYGRAREVLSPERAIKLIDTLILGRFSTVGAVGFFGGESTLAPHTIKSVCARFKELVRQGVLSREPSYCMTTNGTLITDDLAKIIYENNIAILISVDGP